MKIGRIHVFFVILAGIFVFSLPANGQAVPPLVTAAGAQVSPKELLRHCARHYFSRNYAPFFDCADRLVRFSGDGNGISRYSPAIFQSMRAELLLEIGLPKDALGYARKAFDAIPAKARKWAEISGRSDESVAFENFLEQLKDDWAGDVSLPLVPALPEVVAKNIGLLARCHYLNGESRRADYLNIELALFDDAGYRERIYFAFVRNKFDEVVRMKEAKDEEIRQAKSSVLVVLFSPGRPTYEFWENYNVALEQYIYGKSLIETGRLEKAAAALDKLMAWEGLGAFAGLRWSVFFERARLYRLQRDADNELVLLRRAVDTIETMRSTISLEAGKLGFAGDKQVVYQQLVKAMADRGDWAGAFEYAERAKARALVNMLSQQVSIATPPSADDKVRGLLAQAEAPEATVLAMGAGANRRSATAAAREELGKLAPEAASLVSVPSIPLTEVVRRLDPQETLVDFFNTGSELYALVVNGVNVTGFRLDANGVESDVRAFRAALESADAKAGVLGQKLHARLIAPIRHELRGKRLTISPHGVLHYLPFGALSDGSRFLVDLYGIRVMPSASTLVYIRTDKPKKAGRLLALGNPDLGDARFDLPGAQKEAVQVASIFPASKALVRKEATKQAVTEFGAGFSILHIASHGVFDSGAPLNSGLLLAGKNEDAGRLTVSDLYALHLDAELVTLSACETGLGKLASGDDVVGLTRGFLYAGARSIISSLWKVDDDATRVLMTNFYGYLARNIDLREALRLAQLATRERFPHPFFWAAFQITGAAN